VQYWNWNSYLNKYDEKKVIFLYKNFSTTMAKQKKSTWANLGFEETLWSAADKMRNNMDPGEYKHVILWLIFLKYISDSFETQYEKIKNNPDSFDGEREDKDAYTADNVFRVPKEARREFIQTKAKDPSIWTFIDDAMHLIEKENPSLKGVLPKSYARPDLDKARLGEIVDLIGTISMKEWENKSKDVLGRVYEYFLGRFAGSEGKGGGEFYTPQCIVKLLVEMLEPHKGRVYDPACGSWGMFVQSEKFIQSHGWKIDDIAIYGQESNPTTWKLCKMNLAIRWINGNLWAHNADSFHNDLHKDLKADYIIANPPFNISDRGWEKIREDVRWKYGIPSAGNANYAWIQHFIHHLAPTGTAGFVMANGSMSSNQSWEWDIRKNLIEAGLVDCIVALPSQLFYSTMIPACLWFVARDKTDGWFRDRKNEILFIDARKMWAMVTRKNRELTDEDVQKISDTYHEWRKIGGEYEDVKWFCKSANLEEVKKHDYVLTPGRYVGTDIVEDDDETFNEKMTRFTTQLKEQMEQEQVLNQKIKENLAKIGFSI
jgi:type I restriction enzyme M protein